AARSTLTFLLAAALADMRERAKVPVAHRDQQPRRDDESQRTGRLIDLLVRSAGRHAGVQALVLRTQAARGLDLVELLARGNPGAEFGLDARDLLGRRPQKIDPQCSARPVGRRSA